MISAALTDDLSNLAAIVYRPGDDADSLLREFATALIHKGHRIGGLVQRNEKDSHPQHAAMALIDLMTGCVCPISQAGPDCKLDPGALANAALAIGRALDAGVELVIVNKFSTQEAAGKGLRNDLATAVAAGLPVLTAVPEKHFGAWQGFTGGFGTTMTCERTLIDDWWQEISWRTRRQRGHAEPEKAAGANIDIGPAAPNGCPTQENGLSLPLACQSGYPAPWSPPR
jgi:hypothetical protein